MKIPSPRPQKRARIEIIPLIDIMFFLLATFVIVSLSMVKNKGIPVNLPAASSGEASNRDEFTSITVSEDGSFYFNKEKTSLSELPLQIAQLKNSGAEPKVYINGDAKAPFGSAVAVLDEVRKAGIVKIAIETKSRDAK